MLSLNNGGAVCDLLPEVGGAVGRFRRRRARHPARNAAAGAREVRQTACFPLVPFFGRVLNGRIEFHGEHIQLPPDPGFAPNAIHGHGWRNPWHVEESRGGTATLAYDHRADAWPWDYAARESFVLMSESLRIELALTNRSRRARCRIASACIPISAQPANSVEGRRHGRLACRREHHAGRPRGRRHAFARPRPRRVALRRALRRQHAFRLAAHRATIVQRDHAIELASDADFLHVFLPKGESYFCAEPVTAIPDVFNRQAQSHSGFRVLDAGETATVAMTLAVRPSW